MPQGIWAQLPNEIALGPEGQGSGAGPVGPHAAGAAAVGTDSVVAGVGHEECGLELGAVAAGSERDPGDTGDDAAGVGAAEPGTAAEELPVSGQGGHMRAAPSECLGSG